MKTRLSLLALVAGLLLAFGALAAACGGDGEEPALKTYFQRVESLRADFNERSGPLEEEFQRDLTGAQSIEEEIALSRDSFSAAVSLYRDFVDGIDGLDPLPEISDAHDETVEAGRAVVQAMEDIVDELDEADSEAELEGLLDELSAGPFDRFYQACSALQAAADENNIDVDLGCED